MTCLSGFVKASETRSELAYKAPSWCRPGYVCYTLSQVREIDMYLVGLEFDLTRFKIKRLKRFGWVAGCGGIVGPELEQLDLTTTAALGCGALWGYRW